MLAAKRELVLICGAEGSRAGMPALPNSYAATTLEEVDRRRRRAIS
jgi:hypothetical protein